MSDPIVNRYADIINKVGQFVHDHLSETVTLDDLAAYTGFSKYHLNRLFAAATGYQLGEFIQRRKFDCALKEIRGSDQSVTDIALSVGYDSPSSFTRAFSQVFGATPKQVRSGQISLNDRGGTLAPRFQSDHVLEPDMLYLPDQQILGLSGRGFSEQSFSQVAGGLFGQLAALSEDLPYEKLGVIGVAVDNPWAGEQTESRFFAGFLCGLEHSAERLESFLWSAGKWARFLHQGPHSTIWQTVSKVYASWVIPNNIGLKDVQISQRYLNNPMSTPSDELETHLYFAIE